MRLLDVQFFFVTADGFSLVFNRRDQGGPNATVRIKNPVILGCEGQHATLNQLNRELAGMNCFFWMIGLDVWDFPDFLLPLLRNKSPEIRWIFSQRIPRRLPMLLPLEVSLARVFGWYTNWIQVECVIV